MTDPEQRLTERVGAKQRKCWIGLGGHDMQLPIGQTLVGRHDSCQIVLDDPLASRKHALFEFDGDVLHVKDLGSVNGVLLNELRVEGRRQLSDGDKLRLGNQGLVVHLTSHNEERSRAQRLGAQTLTGAPAIVSRPQPSSEEESTVVREGEALETLGLVADKVLAMGRHHEAERILQRALRELLERAQAGTTTDAAQLEVGADYAVRLAQASGKALWVDYVFDLYAACELVLPGAVIERLYSAVRTARGVRVESIRRYLAVIHAKSDKLGPAELFFVRRIEGLVKLASL